MDNEPVSQEPTIDLVREEMRELASSVIEAAGNPTEPFGQYVFLSDEPQAELARYVERTVFQKWFGNSPELLDSEYKAYEASTVFLCIIDHQRRLPAGMARMTLPAANGFKTLNDIEAVWKRPLAETLEATGLDWDLGRVWDVLTIAVMDEYRGKATEGLLTLSILQFGTQGPRLCGGRWTVTVMDLNVLRLVQEMVGTPYRLFPGVESISYLDSPASVPVFADFDEWLPRLAIADPGLHELIAEQSGIPGVMRGPAWAPVLRLAGVDPRPTLATR